MIDAKIRGLGEIRRKGVFSVFLILGWDFEASHLIVSHLIVSHLIVSHLIVSLVIIFITIIPPFFPNSKKKKNVAPLKNPAPRCTKDTSKHRKGLNTRKLN